MMFLVLFTSIGASGLSATTSSNSFSRDGEVYLSIIPFKPRSDSSSLDFCESKALSGDYEMMLLSVLQPLLRIPRTKHYKASIEYWPRPLQMNEEYSDETNFFSDPIEDRFSDAQNSASAIQDIQNLGLQTTRSPARDPRQQDHTFPFPPTALSGVEMYSKARSIDVDPLYTRWVVHHISVFCAQEQYGLQAGLTNVIDQNNDIWPRIEAIIKYIKREWLKWNTIYRKQRKNGLAAHEQFDDFMFAIDRTPFNDLVKLSTTVSEDLKIDAAIELNIGMSAEIVSGLGWHSDSRFRSWMKKAQKWVDSPFDRLAVWDRHRKFPSFDAVYLVPTPYNPSGHTDFTRAIRHMQDRRLDLRLRIPREDTIE